MKDVAWRWVLFAPLAVWAWGWTLMGLSENQGPMRFGLGAEVAPHFHPQPVPKHPDVTYLACDHDSLEYQGLSEVYRAFEDIPDPNCYDCIVFSNLAWGASVHFYGPVAPGYGGVVGWGDDTMPCVYREGRNYLVVTQAGHYLRLSPDLERIDAYTWPERMWLRLIAAPWLGLPALCALILIPVLALRRRDHVVFVRWLVVAQVALVWFVVLYAKRI